MRGADGGPWRRLCALPAFWVVVRSVFMHSNCIRYIYVMFITAIMKACLYFFSKLSLGCLYEHGEYLIMPYVFTDAPFLVSGKFEPFQLKSINSFFLFLLLLLLLLLFFFPMSGRYII